MNRIPILALLLAACGSNTTLPYEPRWSFGFITTFQADTVGRTLAAPLRVLVTDGNSNAPLPGYIINWVALDGGSLSVPVSQTGPDGIASNSFTLGTHKGAQRVAVQEAEHGLADTTVTLALPARAASIELVPSFTNLNPVVHLGDTVLMTVFYDDQYANRGAPCPDDVPWQNLTWTYDTTIVRNIGSLVRSDAVDTRFMTIGTPATFFSVTTECAIAVRSVTMTYALGVAP